MIQTPLPVHPPGSEGLAPNVLVTRGFPVSALLRSLLCMKVLPGHVLVARVKISCRSPVDLKTL